MQVMEQLSNVHIAHTPMAMETKDQMPLTPCRRGLVKHPLLRGRGHSCLCYNCHEVRHITKKCPKKKTIKKYCCHCNSHQHFPNKCIFKHFNMLGEAMVKENIAHIQQAEHVATWCGKCLHDMLGHNKINCPQYEACGKCWVHGPVGFLKTHQCIEEDVEEDLVNDLGVDIYDYVGSD